MFFLVLPFSQNIQKLHVIEYISFSHYNSILGRLHFIGQKNQNNRSINYKFTGDFMNKLQSLNHTRTWECNLFCIFENNMASLVNIHFLYTWSLNISHPLKKTKNKILDRPLLTDEVNSNQVKDDVRKDEICKASFWGDANELHFVLRVCLQSQAHCGIK